MLFVAGNSGCSPGLDALLRTIQVVSGGFDAGPTEILSLLLTMWSQIKDLNRENPGKLKMFDVSFCMFFYDFFFFGGRGEMEHEGTPKRLYMGKIENPLLKISFGQEV